MPSGRRNWKRHKVGPAERWKRFVRVLVFFLAVREGAGWGQHLQTVASGTAAGLANLDATVLLEDRTGAVWVGTESGVYLADGERFVKQEAFSKAGLELIQALREDAKGRIWVLERRHLVLWDGKSIHEIAGLDLRNVAVGGRDLVVLPGDPDAIYLLSAGYLRRIASQDGGRTWTALSAVGPEMLQVHPELRNLTAAIAGGGSTVWAGCGPTLCRLDLSGGAVERFGPEKGVPADVWSALLATRKGELWARGAKGMIRLRAGGSRFEPVAALPAKTTAGVTDPVMVESPSGEVVVSVGDGIAVSSGSSWRVFDHGNGLPEGEMQAMLFDRAGELWLAPEGLGLVRVPGYGNWEGWTKAEGLRNNVVWSTTQSADGTVWSVTGAGLDRLDPGADHFVPVALKVQLGRPRVAQMDAHGHLWIGDQSGQVVEYDPANEAARVAASGLGRVIQLVIDRRQRIWACTQQGLRVFVPEDGWSVAHAPDTWGLPPGYAWSVAEGSDGTMWLTSGQGLFRLDGAAWKPIALPFPGGAEYNFMLAPAPDGTLWVQSKQPFPLLRLRVEGTRAEIVERVPGAEFGSDNLTFMETDRRGWLWVGSDDGVHVFNGVRWVQATDEDGITWNDTDFHAFSEEGDGSVWIGTSNGLSHLLRPEGLFSLKKPTVRLDGAHIGETELRGDTPSFDLRRPVLSVHLLNTSYIRGTAVVYRYRLEGQESEWQVDRTGSLRFPALNAGNYKLSVVGYDTRLHESSAPVSLAFRVLEPWWRRPWFSCVEGALISLVGFAVWRYSVHLLVQRQQGLERLIASRTRELEREKADLLSTRSALLEMTRRDSLTGLLNRAAIFEQMAALCEASLASGRPLAVAMADLDSFKRINDLYGHVMGDTVLRECSRRIEGALRAEDAVGRYGGEELLILLPGLYPGNAAARMEQLRAAIASAPVMHGGVDLHVTCSFGVAWMGGEWCSLESLVEMADAALYRAKQNGRDRVEFALTTKRVGVSRDLTDRVSC